MTIEQLEAETKATIERIEHLKRLKRLRNSKATPTSLEDKFSQEAELLRAEEQSGDPEKLLKVLLNKQMRLLERMELKNGADEPYTGPNYYANLWTQKGRVYGLAAALSIICNTTVKSQIHRAMSDDES